MPPDTLLQPETIRKRAAWNRDYQFDFSRLAEFRDDQQTIASVTVGATPTGLTLGPPGVAGPLVQVQVAGGTAGTTYALTCTITTSAGAVLTLTGRLEVRE